MDPRRRRRRKTVVSEKNGSGFWWFGIWMGTLRHQSTFSLTVTAHAITLSWLCLLLLKHVSQKLITLIYILYHIFKDNQ